MKANENQLYFSVETLVETMSYGQTGGENDSLWVM